MEKKKTPRTKLTVKQPDDTYGASWKAGARAGDGDWAVTDNSGSLITGAKDFESSGCTMGSSTNISTK